MECKNSRGIVMNRECLIMKRVYMKWKCLHTDTRAHGFTFVYLFCRSRLVPFPSCMMDCIIRSLPSGFNLIEVWFRAEQRTHLSELTSCRWGAEKTDDWVTNILRNFNTGWCKSFVTKFWPTISTSPALPEYLTRLCFSLINMRLDTLALHFKDISSS